MTRASQPRGISTVREVLLIEIDRHCAFADCQERALIGLTKAEARAYHGFQCERCRRWNEDLLRQADVPDWWGELASHQVGTER
jgi:hypothetical protein